MLFRCGEVKVYMRISIDLLTKCTLKAAWAFCLIAVLAVPLSKASAGPFLRLNHEIGELTWRSSNSTFYGLQFSLENHYLRLANLGLLDTTLQTWPTAIRFPSTFFNNYFPYLNWTNKIDNLMCDLNSHVCERPRTYLDNPDIEGTEHVFGIALSPPNESRWNITEETALVIPIASLQPFANWIGYDLNNDLTNFPSGWLREFYRDAALGCALDSSRSELDAMRTDEWTLLDQTERSLRDSLRGETPAGCPSRLARHNAYWLSYVATISGVYGSGNTDGSLDAPTFEVFDRIELVDQLLSDGEIDAAWQTLEETITQILSSEPRLPQRIQMPVVAAASDQLIYRATDTSNLAYGPAWREKIEPLSLTERLARLDPDLYVSSVVEAAPLPAIDKPEKPETVAEIEAQIEELNDQVLEIQREIKRAPIVSGVEGVGVRDTSSVERTWTFNASHAASITDGYANSHHHDMIGFSPRTASTPGFFRSPIVLVEKNLKENFDKDHCIFLGGCDLARFEVLDRAALSNIDTMQMVDSERDRLKLVRDDLLDRENGFAFHGKAVASIALANPDSGLMHGIFHHAKPYPVDIDIASDFILPGSWNLQRGQLFGPPTWNISAQTPHDANVSGIKDIISRQLRDNQNRTMRDIFVVSGGHLTNSEIERALASFECKIYPACLVTNPQFRQSVITVVGVERDDDGNVVIFSEGLEPTSVAAFRHPEFQIAAPAEDITVPTVDPFILTKVNGVSFAAPMVSATVAAMRSRPNISASHVIARIMACGVQYQSLTSAVESGVLDFGCSLALGHDLVSFNKDVLDNDDPVYQTLRPGRVLRIWQDGLDNPKPSDVISLTQGTKILGDWRARPVIGNSQNALFGIRRFGDSNNELKVTGLSGANKSVVTDLRGPLDSNLIMEFQPFNPDGTPDGPTVCFRLNDLRDYIPAAAAAADSWQTTGAPRCEH